MDPSLLIPYLVNSDPWVIVALVVFLVLTGRRQTANKDSRRTGGTGRHRAPDESSTGD